jgi:acyl-CoA thioester hydrolase
VRLTVPIRLRWSDIDAYAHVNNAAMLGLLEEVRIQAFWAAADGAPHEGPGILDGRPGAETLSLIAHQEIEYLRPIPYGRQALDCEVWVARLGGASLDVHYEVFSPKGVEPRVLTTRAASTLVLVDAATQKPRRITAGERDAWSPYLEAPVVFAHRRT